MCDSDLNPYPGASVTYTFEMQGISFENLSIEIGQYNITEIVFEKNTENESKKNHYVMRFEFGPTVSLELADEISESLKDCMFDMLCFHAGGKVVNERKLAHSLTPRPGEGGNLSAILPSFSLSSELIVGDKKLNEGDIEEIKLNTKKCINTSGELQSILRIYRAAFGINDPLSRFLLFYQIMLIITGDKNQTITDKKILDIAPETEQTNRPDKPTKKETIYTRLRNEIGHKRDNTDINTTMTEISNCLHDFQYKIIEKIIKDEIKKL
ncbi:methylamine utilization protein MauJ [Candidatus Magnetomonas plexicatena]|uniref:methylamine utilization protein MauJ n=1 Tax=Candidatus Magnetomonas plexicatena TaxID=2552947 RepID=UPI0011008B21|nr:hypothetical protein E2O03_011420 [Nitrospirales bacterium LBB_01]